jgi:hypothetical protein
MEDCRNSVKLDLERFSCGSIAIKLAREQILVSMFLGNFEEDLRDFGLAPNRHEGLQRTVVDASFLIKVEHRSSRFEKTIGKSFHRRHTHQHHHLV